MRFTKQHIGLPIAFRGYNHDSTVPDTIYYGNILEVLPRGIRITYYVPQVARERQASLLTKDAKERVMAL